MADRYGPVTNLGIAYRLFSGSDAIKEITHVIVADRQSLSTGGERLDEQFWVAGFNFIARDPDPAVCTNELHPMLLAIGIAIKNMPNSAQAGTVC